MKPQNKIASFFNVLFVNSHNLGLANKIEKVVKSMGYSEKIFLSIISAIIAVSGLMLVYRANDSFLTEIPAFGGSFTEGVVGSPRFINPILAISNTDEDLSSLIYSGLLKTSENGSLEPDLAESYSINNENTAYDFKIKDNAYFHDGKKVTADDIIFTIQKVLDPVIKSPRQTNWEGVTVEKINDKEIVFILKKPYSQFLSGLTLGILPKHIWEKASSEEFPFSPFNIDPIGSGPYKVTKISRNSGGIPTTIVLNAWNKYTQGSPKIKSITFKFFQNENELVNAYNGGSVESIAGLSPLAAQKINAENLVNDISLPRVFGVFFNQNIAPVFLNKEVREALALATPKKKIVEDVLFGFGRILNGPTPANIETDKNKLEGNIEEAQNILTKTGWKQNANGIFEKKTKKETSTLSFSISTSDAPELKKTAEILKEAWEKIGATVEIKVFEAGDLSQNVIKPRKYDALLFGEVISDQSDLYSFWHSSQRNEPGLNISLYANISVDKALEDIQKENNEETKKIEKEIVFSEIQKDTPAIFLFSPNLLYVKSPKIKDVTLKDVSSLSERFLLINKWFIETDKVWNFFVKV
jgi:peptide/nickel transport system substrate-binding protein